MAMGGLHRAPAPLAGWERTHPVGISIELRLEISHSSSLCGAQGSPELLYLGLQNYKGMQVNRLMLGHCLGIPEEELLQKPTVIIHYY